MSSFLGIVFSYKEYNLTRCCLVLGVVANWETGAPKEVTTRFGVLGFGF